MSDDWDATLVTPDGDPVEIDDEPFGERVTREYEREDVLRELYVERGLSTREIADELNTSQTTVRRNLDRASIETRDASEVNRASKTHYKSAIDKHSEEQGVVTGSASPRIHRVEKELSKEIVDHAIGHSNASAADEYGVSERTVERHRSYWTDGEDAGEVSFENVTRVDDRLCGVMRCAARRGDTLGDLADRHGVAKATVQHHVSDRTAQPCSHDVAVRVPRVSMDEPGGIHDTHVRGDDGTFVEGGSDD